MAGRERADSSGYLFSYMPLAKMALAMKSSANSSRMSTSYAATAPRDLALAFTASMSERSSEGWPRLAMQDTTS